MRFPQFDGHGQLRLWLSRMEIFLTARRLIAALELTSNPIRTIGGLGGMEEGNRSVNLHRQLRVKLCEKAWKFLMKAMQGQPVGERVYVTESAEGTWKAVIAWYQQRGDADRDHLEKEFEGIAMQGDEDPKLLLAHAEGNLLLLKLVIRVGYS